MDITKGNLFLKIVAPKRLDSMVDVTKEIELEKLLLGLLLLLLLQGTADARSALIRWNDNSENEEGFIVERTVSDDCVSGWEVIAYTGKNENFLRDVFIPGACYRAAAYNEIGASTYSNSIRMPLDPGRLILRLSN